MAKRQFKYVGQNVKRVDGVEKVTGAARFVGDLAVPGMLYGKILRSPYPHARIRPIDASRAEALPGVVAVLTAADISDLSPIYNGRPVIAMNKVRYVESPVSGTSLQTEQGDALGMIGGDPAAAAEAKDVLDAICPRRHHLGAAGNGGRAKLAINLILGVNRAALAEVLQSEPLEPLPSAPADAPPETMDWHALDAAYLAHHFNCPTCIAAGRGSRYGARCGAGAALWRDYSAA